MLLSGAFSVRKRIQSQIFGLSLSLCFLFSYYSSVFAQEKADAGKHAKYVFLMIGDGMGANHRLAAEKCLPESQKKLVMDSFPYSCLVKTNSTSGITDSAAAGTALACGVKTNNGVLGLDKDGKRVESLAELLKKRGFKVAIMTSTPINHATPAAFYAHSSGRGSYSEISSFIPDSGFDLFVGEDFLLSKNEQKPDALLKEKGYTLISSPEAFRNLKKGAEKIVFTHKILSAPKTSDPNKITLSECLSKAIELLDDKNGFFIMLEGGQIDWASHANDLATAVKELFAFDDAVKVAQDFQLKNPSETLIVVTADHETGGLELSENCNPSVMVNGQKISKSEIINQLQSLKKEKASFDDFLKKMQEAFGLKELKDSETESIKQAYNAFMESTPSDARAEEIKKMYGTKNPIVQACSQIIEDKSGVKWSIGGHTNANVKTSAIGIGAELFNGEMDNTEIPGRIKKAIGIE